MAIGGDAIRSASAILMLLGLGPLVLLRLAHTRIVIALVLSRSIALSRRRVVRGLVFARGATLLSATRVLLPVSVRVVEVVPSTAALLIHVVAVGAGGIGAAPMAVSIVCAAAALVAVGVGAALRLIAVRRVDDIRLTVACGIRTVLRLNDTRWSGSTLVVRLLIKLRIRLLLLTYVRRLLLCLKRCRWHRGHLRGRRYVVRKCRSSGSMHRCRIMLEPLLLRRVASICLLGCSTGGRSTLGTTRRRTVHMIVGGSSLSITCMSYVARLGLRLVATEHRR